MVCSFTGHRQIPPEHVEPLRDLLRRAIEFAYEAGCRVFCSGGAIGFDSLAAREVILFRMTHPDVELKMLLPCIDQDRSWSASQRDAYAYVLKNSNSVEYVCDEYTPSCMRKRNLRLAESCDIMIAYVGRSNSGSAQTMRFAKQMEKRVYNLYPSV